MECNFDPEEGDKSGYLTDDDGVKVAVNVDLRHFKDKGEVNMAMKIMFGLHRSYLGMTHLVTEQRIIKEAEVTANEIGSKKKVQRGGS